MLTSVSRNLPTDIAYRQLAKAESTLRSKGFTKITGIVDSIGVALSPGSSILVSNSARGKFIGASALGERFRKAEDVGIESALAFLGEFTSGPDLDSHLADILTPILANISGTSSFTTPKITEHLKTNLSVSQKFTGCDYSTVRAGPNWRVLITGRGEKSN